MNFQEAASPVVMEESGVSKQNKGPAPISSPCVEVGENHRSPSECDIEATLPSASSGPVGIIRIRSNQLPSGCLISFAFANRIIRIQKSANAFQNIGLITVSALTKSRSELLQMKVTYLFGTLVQRHVQ